MLHLTMLGGLALEGDQGLLTRAAVRPRSLALLVLIAVAGSHGMSRDKAYLWPESDTSHARNCLKQTLFALRHHLQCDLFAPGVAGLRLSPCAVAVDCWEFEHALERRALQVAVDLYGGPLLDGFHLEGGVGFEYWVETERARLAHRYEAALAALVARAESAGDRVGAVQWWQRLAEHDPFSSRIALGLMEALVEVGDRAGALRYAQRHERLLRQELDAFPDTDEQLFIQQLRNHASGTMQSARLSAVRRAAARPPPPPASHPERSKG
jgi:DNA-binding SARP family transcriptional activator